MASTIDITADTGDAIIEIDRFTNALNAYNDRITQVKQSIAQFNEKGQLIGASVKSQVGAFGELTQQIKYANGQIQVLSSSYKDNVAAAEAAARRQLEAIEKTSASSEAAARRQQAADAETFRKGSEYREKKIQAEHDAATAKKKLDDDEASRIERQGTLFSNVLGRVGRNLVQFASYRAFSNTVEGIQEGIQAAKDFQIQISLIRTISQDKQLSFAEFGRGIRETSDSSGIDIKDVGKAFYDTTSNQIAKGADVAPFVKTATELARVTGSQLPDSVNLLSSAINAYGLSVKDADRLSAIFFRTIDEGRVVSSELANTFGRVAVLGSNMGVSIEDLNAVLAITTQKGFKTADAMTLLTNLLIKLEKPTEATRGFFNSLGVDTGEAAIQLLGFNGVLRKMVEAVKSGQVDVSAFFDEIRGRKQFGVFQQSIDEIETFSNKLKNTSDTMKVYSEAVKIRGESPADLLVKESNKLSNIFKVDLGQAIVNTTADIIKFVGGVDSLKNVSTNVADAVKIATGAFIAYRITGLAATTGATVLQTIATYGLVESLKFVTIGATTATVALAKLVIPLAAVYAGYKIGQELFPPGQENAFGSVDVDKLTKTADAAERFAKAQKQLLDQKKNLETKADNFDTLDTQNKDVTNTYREILQGIANANLANNKFLEEAKKKALEVSEAVKISFNSFLDSNRNSISNFKKMITEAANEIDKSKKSVISYGDSIDQVLFNVKKKYANEDFGGDFGQVGGQKAKLLEQQQESIKQKAIAAFASGTPEGVAEGRKLFDELKKLAGEYYEYITDTQKKLAEASGATGIFQVDPDRDLKPKLQGLNRLLGELEQQNIDKNQKKIDGTQKSVVEGEKQLDLLKDTLKTYQDINIFEKSGQVKADFKTGGKFDKSKLDTLLDEQEAKIRNAAGPNYDQQIALTKLFFDQRRALTAEAGAQERSENFKTYTQQLIGQKEIAEKRIADLKSQRSEEIKKQNEYVEILRNKPAELRQTANVLGEGQGLTADQKKEIENAIKLVGAATTYLEKNANEKDGIKIFNTRDIQYTVEKVQQAISLIERLRDEGGKGVALTFTDKNGKPVTPADARSGIQQQGFEAQQNSQKLELNLSSEKIFGLDFEEEVKKPLAELKAQFPELSTTAQESNKTINQSFKDLANGGVQELINKLKEVQQLQQGVMGPPKPSGTSFNDMGGDIAYAATGGVVGMFPGQPRGADIYPVWAAKGETIVSAQTSAMYKPMLEAIMARRMPRYMAGGGTVGDTNIGDINVTVNGAKTNSDTGRAIATKLERELRRRNISFKQK